MSNSTTLLDTIASNQANKEVVVNALLDAASVAMLWGRHASACSGLTWGYYGGNYQVGGTANAIANGTVTLTASATNYVYANATTGAVSVNTTGFPAGSIPLYQIVAGATTVSSYTDERSYQPSALAGASSGTPYDMACFAPGALTANQKLARVVVPRAVTLPSGLTGSYAKAGTAATASTTLTITQNGTSIGSINFAAGAATGTFTFSSAVTTAAGDVLQIQAPATPDATLADVSVTLVGSR